MKNCRWSSDPTRNQRRAEKALAARCNTCHPMRLRNPTKRGPAGCCRSKMSPPYNMKFTRQAVCPVDVFHCGKTSLDGLPASLAGAWRPLYRVGRAISGGRRGLQLGNPCSKGFA